MAVGLRVTGSCTSKKFESYILGTGSKVALALADTGTRVRAALAMSQRGVLQLFFFQLEVPWPILNHLGSYPSFKVEVRGEPEGHWIRGFYCHWQWFQYNLMPPASG